MKGGFEVSNSQKFKSQGMFELAIHISQHLIKKCSLRQESCVPAQKFLELVKLL